MTKQNKLFSWLGFGKKAEAAVVGTTAEQQVQPVEQQAEVVPAKDVVEVLVAEAVSELEAPLPVSTPVEIVPAPVAVQALQPQPAERPGFFARLKQGLTKTSQNLGNGLASLFLGKKIDDDLYEELETQLLMADVGVDTSQKLIKQLVQHANRKQLKDADALFDKLQQEMALLLDDVEQPLQLKGADGPFVILMVGVNGVGKTTTVAKLAAQFAKRHGADQVALITTDSFRIGAYEQLATFGRIIGCPVKQVKDSEELAQLLNQLQQRKLILIDTAGMSQRDVRLAEKLASLVHNSRVKIKSYLVLSATSQARVMQETVEHFKRIPLAGCIFTKLDECLSLGEIINVAIQNALPVSYLTNGQRVPEDIEMAEAKTMVAKAEQLRTSNSSTGYQWYSDTTARVEGTYA